MNILGEPTPGNSIPPEASAGRKGPIKRFTSSKFGESLSKLLTRLNPRQALQHMAKGPGAQTPSTESKNATVTTEEHQRILDPDANGGQGGYVKRIYDPEIDTLSVAKDNVSVKTSPEIIINNPSVQSDRMQELIDLADSPAAASLLRTDLTSDEIAIILQERERLHQERAQRIEEQVPDDILLPTADSLLHRTDTIDHVLGMLDNGLWVRNPRGLDTTAERLQKRTDDQEENGNTKHTNAKKLAARHSPGGHMSRFVVVMTFPRVMPLEVQKVYNEMDPTERRGYGRMNAYLDWDNIPEDAQLSHIFAVLPSKYMTGVVDQDTGQYYTKEQFKQEFGAL